MDTMTNITQTDNNETVNVGKVNVRLWISTACQKQLNLVMGMMMTLDPAEKLGYEDVIMRLTGEWLENNKIKF